MITANIQEEEIKVSVNGEDFEIFAEFSAIVQAMTETIGIKKMFNAIEATLKGIENKSSEKIEKNSLS